MQQQVVVATRRYIGFLLTAVTLIGCTYSKPKTQQCQGTQPGGAGGSTPRLTWVRDIEPIFQQQQCANCHGEMATYENVLARTSRVAEKISTMPPSPRGPVSAEMAQKVRDWIAQGAPRDEGDATACAVPGTPIRLTLRATGPSEVQVSWEYQGTDQDGFELQWKEDGQAAFTTVPLSAGSRAHLMSGLLAEKTYLFRIAGFNSLGQSDWTETVRVSTPAPPITIPLAPTELSAFSLSPTEIRVTWQDRSNNERGFRIERRNGTLPWTQVASTAPGETLFRNTGVAAGTIYTYRAFAFNDSGPSLPSNPASADTTVPAAPTALSAVAVSHLQINLTWGPSPNAQGYKIERKTGTGPWVQIVERAPRIPTSFPNSGLTPQTLYTYRVRAFNDDLLSAYSNENGAVTDPIPSVAPAPPENLVATALTPTQIRLTWIDRSTTEIGFKIFRSPTNVAADFELIHTTAASVTSYQDDGPPRLPNGLLPGRRYYYRVLATAGPQLDSLPISANALLDDLLTADFCHQSQRLPQYTLSGGLRSGALVTCTGCHDSRPPLLRTPEEYTNNRVAIDDSVWNGRMPKQPPHQPLSQPLRDMVRRWSLIGGPANLGEFDIFCRIPTVPSSFQAARQGEDTAVLTWVDTSNNESAFQIERAIGTGAFSLIANATANSTTATFRDLRPLGTDHHFRIRGRNSRGYSAFSPIQTIRTAGVILPPSPPTDLTFTVVSAIRIDLAWADNSTNEQEFRIERSPDGTNFTQISTTPPDVRVFQNFPLTASTTYYYRVRASNAGGDSVYTNTVRAVTQGNPPSAPTNLSATSSNSNHVELRWMDTSQTETGFKIFRSDGTPGNYVLITTTPSNRTLFLDTNRQPSTRYYYEVAATNAFGDSSRPPESYATTLALISSDPCDPTIVADPKSVYGGATGLGSSLFGSGRQLNRCTECHFAGSGLRSFETRDGILGARDLGNRILSMPSGRFPYGTPPGDERPPVALDERQRVLNWIASAAPTTSQDLQDFCRAPLEPRNVEVVAMGPTRVRIRYTASHIPFRQGFEIERKVGAGEWAPLVTTGAAELEHFDTDNVLPQTTYTYRIFAVNRTIRSASSEEKSDTTPSSSGAPAAPTNLQVTALSESSVQLTWMDMSTNEDGFRIYRRTGADPFELIFTTQAGAQTHEDQGLLPNTRYDYQVSAYNGEESGFIQGNATTPLANPFLTLRMRGGKLVRNHFQSFGILPGELDESDEDNLVDTLGDPTKNGDYLIIKETDPTLARVEPVQILAMAAVATSFAESSVTSTALFSEIQGLGDTNPQRLNAQFDKLAERLLLEELTPQERAQLTTDLAAWRQQDGDADAWKALVYLFVVSHPFWLR